MKTTSTITINGKPIAKHVADVTKAINAGKRQNLKVRNDVLRLFSDFIATRGPFKDASGSSAFTKSTAAPDMQGSLKSFEDYFGIAVEPSNLAGGAQAYTEIKQRISKDTSTTITSIQLGGADLSQFESAFGLTQYQKADSGKFSYTGTTISSLKSDSLVKYIQSRPDLEREIVTRAQEKFQNALYINYLDKRHNNKPTVSVLKNAKSVLQLNSITSPYLEITARVVSLANSPTINLQIKLSAAGEKELATNSVDISRKFHESLGKYVANRFVKYAMVNRLGKIKDFDDYIKECITLANEFADGSNTPIEYESNLSTNSSAALKQNVSMKGAGKTRQISKPKPQKFISSAQWTYLVQKRLGDSMLSFGEPEPPDIKERSGRFRRSVDVTANYRTKTIQYTYNPLYRSLEHYGYHPELQVERSIRQVAQDLYAREFSILRRGGLS
jgi:hypothetical protein